MAKQSSWIHGINVVSRIQSTNALEQVNAGQGGIDNTDVLGYKDSAVLPPNLSKLCGKWFQSKGNVSNAFLCATPTRTTINGVRPSFHDVMVLYSADASVTLNAVALFGGPNVVAPHNNALNTSRNNNPQDQIEGMTSFSADNFVVPQEALVDSTFSFLGVCV
jgi:hypothetical protein